MANIQTKKDKKVIIIPIAVAAIILAIILSLTKCDNQKEVYVPATQNSSSATTSPSASEPIWVPAPVTEPEPAAVPAVEEEKTFEPVPALTAEEEKDAFVKYGPEK